MDGTQLSRLLVEPLARQIDHWIERGKLDDTDLDRILSPDARSIIDLPASASIWMPIAEVETLVALVAEQLGGGTGLVEWSRQVVHQWQEEERIASLVADARGIVDAAGYVVSQLSEWLVLDPEWRCESGRERFAVSIFGLSDASVDLRTLLGALLAGVAESGGTGFDDVRFEGVDAGALVVFGERDASALLDDSGESRLHRAALIG